MKLCSEHHDEVCYEAGKCPVCERIKEIEKLTEEVGRLEDEASDLEQEVLDLEQEILDAAKADLA
jgi:cell division protein FtsB